jgi:hypothetical protein
MPEKATRTRLGQNPRGSFAQPHRNFAVCLLIILTTAVCLSGCATTKEFVATNGSRSDGTVVLSYEYGMFESPQEDQQQGAELATSTCGGWGYSGTQPFGETRQCNAVNGYGSCIHWMVTRRYQCLGSPHDVAPASQTMAPPQPTTAAPQIRVQAPAGATQPMASKQPNVESGENWDRQ